MGVVELHERRDLRGHRRRRLRRPRRLGPEPAAAVVQEPQVGVPAVVRVLVVHEGPGRVPGRGARRRAEPEVRARVPRGHALHGAPLHRHRVRRHGHAAVAAAADLAELPVGPFEVGAVAPEAHEPPPRHREAGDLVVDGVAAAAVVDEGPRGVPAPRPFRVPGLAALPGLARVQADELRDGLVGLVVREPQRVVRPHEAVPGQPRVPPGEVEVVDDDPDAAALSQAQPVHDAEDLVDAVARGLVGHDVVRRVHRVEEAVDQILRARGAVVRRHGVDAEPRAPERRLGGLERVAPEPPRAAEHEAAAAARPPLAVADRAREPRDHGRVRRVARGRVRVGERRIALGARLRAVEHAVDVEEHGEPAVVAAVVLRLEAAAPQGRRRRAGGDGREAVGHHPTRPGCPCPQSFLQKLEVQVDAT